MLMNLGPVLVMVMPVGYAVSEQENCKYNYVKEFKLLHSYQRETEKDNEEEREGRASFCRALNVIDSIPMGYTGCS